MEQPCPNSKRARNTAQVPPRAAKGLLKGDERGSVASGICMSSSALDPLIHDWNPRPPTPRYPLKLNDETLRDGLQSPSVFNPSIPEKLELLHYMEDLGLYLSLIHISEPTRLLSISYAVFCL